MKYAVLIGPLLLSGCAGISFHQLNADLSEKNAPEGAVYYLPKPVLLVSVAPVSATANANGGEGHIAPPAPAPAPPPAPAPVGPGHHGHAPVAPPPVPGPPVGGGAGALGGAADTTTGSKDASKDTSSAPTAAASDQSYSVSVPGYTLKLVYVPDRSRPMRLSVHAGLGTASLKPTIQNGWMLTGFDAQADSKASELLASVAQMVTAAKGPAAAAATSATGGGLGDGSSSAPDTGIMRPGLYDFHYDATGKLTGLCPLTFFTTSGPVAPQTVPANCQ